MLAVFDVVGTLFSLERARTAIREHGHPPDVVEHWFARLLHASFASTLADRYTPYGELAEPTLRQVLERRGLSQDGVEAAVGSLRSLDPRRDAEDCLSSMRGDGHRLVALTNGGMDSTRELMDRSGLGRHFEGIHSADEVERCKPAPEPYRMVLDRYGASAPEAVMVAVHGWDVRGADAVGMRTAYVEREEGRWPFTGSPPDLRARDLAAVPEALRGD